MDLYFLCSILTVDIFIVLWDLFIGLLWAYSAYIIGLILLAYDQYCYFVRWTYIFVIINVVGFLYALCLKAVTAQHTNLCCT
jgi:hypothetical protein